MWSNGALWSVRVKAGGIRLILPLPVYVLADLLQAWEDLCEVILPRFGLPNYAALLRELMGELTDVPPGLPLLDVRAKDTAVAVRRVEWGE